MAITELFSEPMGWKIRFIVTFSHIFSPAAFGSLSICENSPNIPSVPVQATGSGLSSEPRPAVSFLKVTEFVSTSPLNTSHMDTGTCSTVLLNTDSELPFCCFFTFLWQTLICN